jgi:HSP20 family protein
MAETAKPPVKTEKVAAPSGSLTSLREEIDRLFENFDRGLWNFPFRGSGFDIAPSWKRGVGQAVAPADITETDDAYEVTVDLPGMDEKNIEVKVANGSLSIKGEKQEEKEEKKKDYYLQERHFGSFQRSFALPDGVDADRIQASFKKGVLSVTLPKNPEAIKPEKKIEVRPAT